MRNWHTRARREFSHRAKQGANSSVQRVPFSHISIQGAKFPVQGAKIFASVGHNFEALPGAQIMHMICLFKDLEVRNLEIQTVCDLDLKRRSYGHLKTTMQS